MTESPTVAILGCGYVGLTTAAILSNCGYKTYALEPLKDRLDIIKTGKSFFYEAGVDPLISAGIESDNFVPTDSYETALAGSDIVFCCMGTPDNADGSSNLTYVYAAVDACVAHMKPGSIFVQKSTVPVGTSDQIISRFKAANKDVAYVSNPEFLRESTAILDTLWTDRVVVGSDDAGSAKAVLDLYRTIEDQHDKLGKIAGIAAPKQPTPTEYITTKRSSAELIKVSANAFLALKISFANSIAKLADKTGADIIEVMEAVGADKRIGRAFLNAGRGYGGGCFPKDVSGLIRSAEDYGVELGIMEAVSDLNASMPHYIINKVEHVLGGNQPLANMPVSVLGLAFKAGTSDSRRSPAIAIANTLAERGAQVTAFDPKANHEAKPELHPSIELVGSQETAITNSKWLFITTDWSEFIGLDFATIKAQNPTLVGVVDCMNRLDGHKVKAAGLDYIAVGR